MTLDQQKNQLVANIERDRRVWYFVIVPQLLLAGVVSLFVMIIAGYGRLISIFLLREKAPADVLTKNLGIMVAVGFSFLAMFITKLFKKLNDLSIVFMDQNRRFTSFKARVLGAASVADFEQVVKEYQK